MGLQLYDSLGRLLVAENNPLTLPQNMFFVSPSYSGSSPYFTTISGALAACDGNTATAIIINEGTYNETVYLKNNVALLGQTQDNTIIKGWVSGTIGASPHVNIENLTIDGTAVSPATSSTLNINLNNATTGTGFVVRNCSVSGNLGAININNSAPAAHFVWLDNVRAYASGSNTTTTAALYLTNPSSAPMRITECNFSGSVQIIGVSGAHTTAYLYWCTLGSIYALAGSTMKVYSSRITGNSYFTSSATPTLIQLNHCELNGQISMSGNITLLSIFDCYFLCSGSPAMGAVAGYPATASAILVSAGATPVIRMNNSSIDNAQIQIDSNTGTYQFTNSYIKCNMPTSASIVSTQYCSSSIFLGDVVMDTSMSLGLVPHSASFNTTFGAVLT